MKPRTKNPVGSLYVSDDVISWLERFPEQRLSLKPSQGKLEGRLKVDTKRLDEINSGLAGDWYVDTASLLDIHQIAEIAYENFGRCVKCPPQEAGEFARYCYYECGKYLLVARDRKSDGVLGYISIADDGLSETARRPVRARISKDNACIASISIHPGAQRSGIGSVLLNAAEKFVAADHRGLFLHSWRRDSDVSHNFFIKNDYKDLLDIPRYYLNGDRATVMYKPLR